MANSLKFTVYRILSLRSCLVFLTYYLAPDPHTLKNVDPEHCPSYLDCNGLFTEAAGDWVAARSEIRSHGLFASEIYQDKVPYRCIVAKLYDRGFGYRGIKPGMTEFLPLALLIYFIVLNIFFSIFC
jgi:hypothetical protein